MKTRLLTIVLFAITAVVPNLFGQAAATKPDPAVRHTAMLTKMLTLTADQQTQVQALLTAQETSAADLQTQLQTHHTSLVTAIKNNDLGGINAITTQLATPRQQLDALHATTAAKIYALLTTDQKAKVDRGIEMLASMGGRGGFGPGGPGGAGPGGAGPGPGGPGQMMRRGGRPQ